VPFGDETVLIDACEYHLPNGIPGVPEVTCYLLRTPRFKKADDSPEQAVLLCRATVEFLRFFADFRPDIIHCNDWHTGLIPVYLNTLYESDPYLGCIATLYTTHNTGYGYQGAFPSQDVPAPTQKEILHLAGLDASHFQPQRTSSLEHQTLFNFAKGGFGYADLINTVSLTYAREIQTPAFGGGFDGLLRERSHDLCGIVDGIDVAEWNPCCDPFIAPEDYSTSDTPEDIQCHKHNIRQMLQEWNDKEGHMPFKGVHSDSILVSVVGRIADQKFPILMPVLEDICRLPGVQVAILGSAHPLDRQGQGYAEEIRVLAGRLKTNLFFYDGFDIPLSHLVYASADMLLMPSIYEPCGLAQMIAMRYGTIPVVRSVGGLDDTVIDEYEGLHATGLKFKEVIANQQEMANIPASAALLLENVKRAVHTMRSRPARWYELIRNGMSSDFSWSIPAPQYMKLYHEAVARCIRSHISL